jgi:glycosyltransferase involved in cell wall biosynthesis
MRICIIYQGEFPPAERIAKEAKSLAAAGHQIFLLCNNYGMFQEHEEQVGPMYTMRIRPTFTNRTVNRIVKFPIFFNPLWIAQLVAAVRRWHIEVLQVVDIPLSAAALYVGRSFGIPVVLDMWENYPEALRGWAQKDWTYRIFKNPAAARMVELWVTRRVDHIVTVVDEQKERLVRDGVAPERISVVTNGLDEELFASAEARHDTLMDDDPDEYKLLYVGALTVERGLSDMILALKWVLPKVPKVALYIGGAGPEEPALRELAVGEGVFSVVRFLGWVPFSEIASYIIKSSLCVVPHLYNDFINTTIPNKIFQYMWLSKPVLVSDAKPLERIVRECRAGFVYRSGNPQDAASKILEAYQMRNTERIGARGHECVRQKYTWEHCARQLVSVYQRLDREHKERELERQR